MGSPTAGELNKSAVMNNQQVLNLRRLYKEQPFNIPLKAKEIGVCTSALWRALTGRTYGELPDRVVVRKTITAKIADEHRREYKSKPFNIHARAKKLGFTSTSFYRAMKGYVPGCVEAPITGPRSFSAKEKVLQVLKTTGGKGV